MKNIKYIILLILISALSSCEEMFDKNPTDQLSSGSFWQTEQDVEMALTGVYRKMQFDVIAANTRGGGSIGHWEGLSDNAYCPNSWESHFTNIANGEIVSTTGGVQYDLYYDCYRGIVTCNNFLENVDNVEGADQALLTKYKAETRFIRAFYYYWLVQCYGGVPLVDKVLTVGNMNIPRSSKADVLNFMYGDLDFAIANLPDVAYSGYGHIVKGAALAFKARIKLFEEEYAEAASLAKQVIDGGLFSLANDYTANFIEDSGQDNCPEIIFSIKYLGPDNPNMLDKVYGVWQSSVPLEGYINSHEDGDKRLKWNVLLPGDDWPIGSAIGYPEFIEGFTVTNTGLIKWVNPSADASNWTSKGNDVVHMRYAEILLVYAEAKLENGDVDASVYEALNLVRNRAGLEDLPSGLSIEELRERIRHERRVELAFEGQRYFDLKRWGIIGDIVPTLNNPPNQTTTKRVWKDHFSLWPIPQSEIDKAPEILEQNYGY